MKFITSYRQGCIKFNENTEDVSELKPIRSNVDWQYLIDEDGVFAMGGKKQEVKTGDIVIKFYENSVTPFIVIKSEEWAQIIKNKEQEIKGHRIDQCPDHCCCESAN